MIRSRRIYRRRLCSIPALALAVAGVGHGVAQAQPSPQFPKRGLGAVNESTLVNSMNSNWYYTWGRTPNANHANTRGEFVPMAWGASSVSVSTNFQQLIGQSSEYILGFNEPERTDQANMTVASAIALWPQLMATGKKLVSPAVSDNQTGRDWLVSFMSEINRLNYRVDAVAFHWYGDIRTSATGAANSLASRVDWYRNNFTNNSGQKYPVWLTEFAGLDFTGGVNPVTPAMNDAFVAAALPLLDSRSYLERYAWFAHRTEASLGTGTTTFTPTETGYDYSGRTYTTGQTCNLVGDEGTDTFYMRGGTIQNTGTLKTLNFADFIDGSSRVQGDGDIDFRNGWVRIRTGATLGKWQANDMTFAGITVFNDGAIAGKQGFIIISDGAVVQGTGYIRTEYNADTTPEGIILTESAPGLGGTTINNRIWLNGGQFNVPAGVHTLNGELTLSSNTGSTITGSLTVNGPLTGPGTFAKYGTGTLRLNQSSSNTGAITISAGTLMIANTSGSATGTSSLTIGANASLSGNGAVGGTAITINGTVFPANVSLPVRPLALNAPVTFGSASRTVIDVDTAFPESISSTGTVALNGTLQLVPVTLPADLVPMTLVAASGLTGIYSSIDGVRLASQPNRGLAVTYSATGVVVRKTLLGDANVDGTISSADFNQLVANFGKSGSNGIWAKGDFTGNAIIDTVDFNLLLSNFGLTVPAPLPLTGIGSVVPEPTSLAAVALVGMGLLSRRSTRRT